MDGGGIGEGRGGCFFFNLYLLKGEIAGLLLTIMPSCHVFGRFLFFFSIMPPSCHGGWWGKAFAIHHLGISPQMA